MQRNLNHLIGWNLDASDGQIGKVEDFYFDDETWTVRLPHCEYGGLACAMKDSCRC
jgi:hypothetical protein